MPHRFEQFSDSAIPIRKDIDMLNLARDIGWDLAIIQPHWQKEDFFRRNARGDIEGVLELALKMPALGN